jgi:diguanylate cyclase (GGDEF)-like protein
MVSHVQNRRIGAIDGASLRLAWRWQWWTRVMRLISRTDTPLAAGLVIGALILFRQPLRVVLDWARSIEGDYHLDLVPALVMLTALFAFHQVRKRRQSQADMLTAAAEARQHLARTQELEALVTFGRTLASALDVSGLRYAVSKCLPRFTGECGTWVLVTRQGTWQTLSIDPVTEQELTRDDLERMATAALAMQVRDGSGEDAHREGIVIESTVCFPLMVGRTVIGVLGVSETATALDAPARHALGVAASLMSIAIRNVTLLVDTREGSVQDPLTGCLNRKPGLDQLDAELRRAKRSGQPLSVLMLDVDHFKQINDRFGHLCGDLVLGAIGRHLVQALRGSDIKCRFGGDEFILVLPDTPLQGAQQVANAIRQAIVAQPVEHNGQALPVTVSIGVACAEPLDVDIKAVIARADHALYSAKESGRDRSCTTSEPRRDVAGPAPPAAPPSFLAHDLELTA